jgi:hypothetical protein
MGMSDLTRFVWMLEGAQIEHAVSRAGGPGEAPTSLWLEAGAERVTGPPEAYVEFMFDNAGDLVCVDITDGPIRQVGERFDDRRTSKGQRSSDVRRFSKDSYSGRLLRAFAFYPGLTDKEATDEVVGLADSTDIGRWEGCRRRCSDLRAAGYIMDTGQERDGRIVWEITPLGDRAYRTMLETGWSHRKETA